MPYGNSNSDTKKEFDKVYRFLIRTAVEMYDNRIELIRQDHTNEGGQVLSNVIDNLSSGDLVIADLSNLNWNVAYELGIRHTLSKTGTILICNDQTPLPFDIQHLNTIIYPRDTWMDEIDEVAKRIVLAITNSLKSRKSDSPVHLQFPALPESLVEMLNNNNDQEQQRIMTLTNENHALRDEIEQLKQRLEDAGLDANSKSNKKVDFTTTFLNAVKNREYISEAAVDKLRELSDDKNYEEFARFLAKVLEEGYIDETDCRNIYILCRRLGIPEITKKYIETAAGFYPDNQELQGFLANEYSQDYRQREHAQTIANDMLGLKRVNGKFQLMPKIRSERMLKSFFDVYLHLKLYSEIIEIGKLLLKSNPSMSVIILQNMATSARRLEQLDFAFSAICRALHLDPFNDMIYYRLSFIYSDLNNPSQAFEVMENAVYCDNTDEDFYYCLAGFICDDSYARTENGVVEKIDVRDKERYVLPYILQAFYMDHSTIQRAVTFLKKNKITSRIPDLIAVYKDEISFEEAFADIDMNPVYYCYSKKDEILSAIEKLPDDFDKYIN